MFVLILFFVSKCDVYVRPIIIIQHVSLWGLILLPSTDLRKRKKEREKESKRNEVKQENKVKKGEANLSIIGEEETFLAYIIYGSKIFVSK